MGYHQKKGDKENRMLVRLIFELPEFLVEESEPFRSWLLTFLLGILHRINAWLIRSREVPGRVNRLLRWLFKGLTNLITAVLSWITDLMLGED